MNKRHALLVSSVHRSFSERQHTHYLYMKELRIAYTNRHRHAQDAINDRDVGATSNKRARSPSGCKRWNAMQGSRCII